MGYELHNHNQNPPSVLDALIHRKSFIEASLDAHLAVLISHNAHMNTPLVDPAGFPRPDIDIVAIRTARVRIIELRNDLQAVLEDLKKALENVHADARHAAAAAAAAAVESSESESSVSVPIRNDDDGGGEQLFVPFARVDGVAPDSPAASAGIRREDLILAFGSITHSSLPASSSNSNATSLAPLASLATSHEDRPLTLKILRNAQHLSLTLVPRKWGGRGLIGCAFPHHIHIP